MVWGLSSLDTQGSVVNLFFEEKDQCTICASFSQNG
jgi:hypothetical protein